MSLFVNINEKPPEYYFIDDQCIGRKCFHPVTTDRRGAGCYNRMHHGCPYPLPEFSQLKQHANEARGWRLVP